jgi:DNA-binding PadR family transcriptional regulator
MALFDRTALQRDLLFVIASTQQPSGQDLKQRFEAETSTDLNRGNIYPNLDRLVGAEFVEKGKLDSRANYYTLTDRGSRCLLQRNEWERAQLQGVEIDR